MATLTGPRVVSAGPSALTILDAMAEPALFAPWFTPEATWRAWRAFLAALFACPMTEAEAALYRVHTGRQTLPTAPAREAWLVVGRRGGKSRVAALVATWLACFTDYRPILAPGERGTIMLLAADRRQARTVFRYVEGLLDGVPMLAALVERRTEDALFLANRVVIEVHTASFRAVRGYTVLAAIADEIAFWRDESSANPDTEIMNALRPSMVTVPGALLLAISSPYARRGALYDAHRTHYGRDGDPILVWQASTLAMNPTVDARVIAEAYERDEAVASAEYGALFRQDLERFVSPDALDAVIVTGRHALPPDPEISYVGFCDPSGGAQDSMTLAVAHDRRGVAVLDLVLEWRPPFSPEAVVIECATMLGAYRVRTVVGDRYAGEWPRERFRKSGITYEVADHTKSELYGGLLPLINSRLVELLDEPRLRLQLMNLERRTSRGGRDVIDHAPGGHDDVANAAAGALALTVVPTVEPLRLW